MKTCSICGERFTNFGLASHLAKAHGLKLKDCPVIGCHARVLDVRAHAEKHHPEWMMHDGRFVWEVLD